MCNGQTGLLNSYGICRNNNVYLGCFEDVEKSLDGVTEDEDEDDPHEQRGHGGVAAMCIPLGDGVVVRMSLHEKANSCFAKPFFSTVQAVASLLVDGSTYVYQRL